MTDARGGLVPPSDGTHDARAAEVVPMHIDPDMDTPSAQQVLLDSLLYSVSHDLRSPLLTMTLSSELLESGMSREAPLTEGATLALNSLRQGAADIERMLQTLMLLSRARRRTVDAQRGALQVILGGHTVRAHDLAITRHVVAVDPLHVREMLDAVAGDAPLEVYVRIADGCATIEFGVSLLEHGPTPMHAVASSLKQYAGSPVEALAVGQILVERQGGQVTGSEGRVRISLPLAEEFG